MEELFGALPVALAPVLLTLRCAPGHACGVTISALPRYVREKVRALTKRTWGVSMERRLGSLNRYVQGWFGYLRISRTWDEVLELDKWLRRRVRQCYWKQWKRSRQRRRMLLRLGANPREVYLASRSRKGCWRMSTNSIVQAALTNEWLDQQGVPNLQATWIAYHYPSQTTPSAEASANPETVIRSEPPSTDPYARWCGGRELITPGYPISPSSHRTEALRTIAAPATASRSRAKRPRGQLRLWRRDS